MQRKYTKYRETLIMITDLIIVTASYFIATMLKTDFTFSYLRSLSFIVILKIMISMYLVFGLSFFITKIYHSLWKYSSIYEVLKILIANLISMFILSFICMLMKGQSKVYMFTTIVMVCIINVLLMTSVRMIYRIYRRMKISQQADKKVLIVGAGDGGVFLLKELSQNPNIGYQVVGFLDDFKKGKIVSGIPVVGMCNELKKVTDKQRVDEVLIAMPSAPKEKIREIYEMCQSLQVPVKIMKDIQEILSDSPFNKQPIKDIKIEDLLGRGEIHLQQEEISSYIQDKVICVTGASGSIGSELCRQIMKFHPKKLILVDINENSLYMLVEEFRRLALHERMYKDIEIMPVILSIREKDAIAELFKREQPHVVYHAAAHKHVPLMEKRPMEAIKNNVFGTYNVMLSCIECHVAYFILISTDKAVNPTNVMGATKRMTEMMLQAYGKNGVTKMAAVRFGNVLGSNGSVIPIFKAQIADGGPLTLTSKEIQRYFMTIPEATQLMLQAGYYASTGEIFVLDMGQPVKILELAKKMIRLSGYQPYKDIDIVEVGLRPGEKMYEELTLDKEKTSKTKNNLIYKNEVLDITMTDIQDKLATLQQALSQHVSNEQLKSILMELISEENHQNTTCYV